MNCVIGRSITLRLVPPSFGSTDLLEPGNQRLRRNLLDGAAKTADLVDPLSSNVGTRSEEHGMACSRHWYINSPCSHPILALRYNK
jgi:hypothetical protein